MPVAVWLSLLPYAEPEDLRSWLGESGAAELARRLDAAGLSCRDFERSPATWPIVAAVLAERLGHPDDVIEGTLVV